jgi:polyferredoxin
MRIFKLKFLLIILGSGILGGIIVNLSPAEPIDRYIHVENFRYGKKPEIIRCNRGDRLHLTFSTNDTGHSFFLEEFGIDAKVSPGAEGFIVFDPGKPEEKPEIRKELVITASHHGLLKYLVSKSQFRCHVWCGPLHAFEQGSLIILPNTLLGFVAGCLLSLILMLLFQFNTVVRQQYQNDSLSNIKFSNRLNRVLKSPVTRLITSLAALVFIYVVIIISTFGTHVAGRNLGTILVWIIWLFVLITVLTPLFGKLWCYVCPIPFFGDLFQRGSVTSVRSGKTGRFHNRFSGLNLKWPSNLDNSWLMLFSFLLLATFSTTIVSVPRISGLIILFLIILATFMSLVFELRAFCRYICPINAFIGHYARISNLSLRPRDTIICSASCKGKFCELGNTNGWACPYGLNVENIQDNSKCGMCMQCLNSCTYNNASLGFRSFGSSPANLNLSESFLGIALMSMAIVYSILYHGPWAELREFINIVDKNNWNLFLIYSISLWSLTLVVLPALFWGLAWISKKYVNPPDLSTLGIFKSIVNAMIPLGLMLWVAFIIPMLLVNFTFILQSFSDPFGWGWNWLGFASLPWHQVIPDAIPWLQVLLILAGVLLSIRNLYLNSGQQLDLKSKIRLVKIVGTALCLISFVITLFYTSF